MTWSPSATGGSYESPVRFWKKDVQFKGSAVLLTTVSAESRNSPSPGRRYSGRTARPRAQATASGSGRMPAAAIAPPTPRKSCRRVGVAPASASPQPRSLIAGRSFAPLKSIVSVGEAVERSATVLAGSLRARHPGIRRAANQARIARLERSAGAGAAEPVAGRVGALAELAAIAGAAAGASVAPIARTRAGVAVVMAGAATIARRRADAGTARQTRVGRAADEVGAARLEGSRG